MKLTKNLTTERYPGGMYARHLGEFYDEYSVSGTDPVFAEVDSTGRILRLYVETDD